MATTLKPITNELINIADYEPHVVALFENNKVADITAQIIEHCSSVVHDITTDDGKKELKQFVARIKKSSKLLDDLGKEHTAKLKALPKIVDQSRKNMRDRLEQLAVDVRKPLTDWEEAEEKRKTDIMSRMSAIDPFQRGVISIAPGERSTESLRELLAVAERFIIDDSLSEYRESAQRLKEEVKLKLSGLISIQVGQEEEQRRLEAERLEREAIERKEREERIAKEAAENARLEAERKAEVERQAILQREQEAKEALIKAEKDRIAAEERAKIEKELAVKAEQERHAKEQEAIKAKEESDRIAAEKKAQNVKHRAKVHNTILGYLSELDGTPDAAKNLITKIAKGEIPELTINY